MNREDTLERLDPLATAIRELLLREWQACRLDRSAAAADSYDDYIPAILRLTQERHSRNDATNIEHIAAYLNFVVKNYLGTTPDKALNRSVAEKIFSLAEATRQRRAGLPDFPGRMAI